jgi:hypothetical protein
MFSVNDEKIAETCGLACANPGLRKTLSTYPQSPQTLDFQGFREKPGLFFLNFVCYNVRTAKQYFL